MADQNHASDLIKRRLVQIDPNQALRYTNLYSRLLALPVLNHKWAMLYLLYQLSDSQDPNELDPVAFAEFQRERARRREEEKAQFDQLNYQPELRNDSSLRSEPSAEDYRPTELRDVFQRPSRETRATDSDVRNSSRLTHNKYPSSSRESKQAETPREEASSFHKRDVAIRSKLLADNYTDIDPSEPALLRDLPYTLQGLSSSTLPFGKSYTLELPPTLPPPLIYLLHSLAEPSLLYRQLEDFVQDAARGLLGQSLSAAISDELRSYLTLVATLEGQIRRALSTIDETAPRSGIGKAGVTLKRCVVWTREATMGLRLMSMISEESKTKKGGQLVTLIHDFASTNGDPVVSAFAERLLTPVTRPFYDILRHWIYDGELSDPYQEFFVQEQAPEDQPKGKSGSTNVWEDKYYMDTDMVPSMPGRDFTCSSKRCTTESVRSAVASEGSGASPSPPIKASGLVWSVSTWPSRDRRPGEF